MTDKWTLNFETWRLKKSFVIKTTTNSLFFAFSNFIQAYRQLYYYARKKLTAVTCAYLGNQPSPMRNLPKPLLHYKNSSLFLYPPRKSIWCNKLSKYGRSDFVVFRESASLLKNNLCDFFSAFCRWEYLFNRKVNVCFFQDEIVSFCPQKIECLHFPHRKKIRVNATRRIGTPRSVNIQLEERERATIGREISLDGHTQARPTYTWPISQKCKIYC